MLMAKLWISYSIMVCAAFVAGGILGATSFFLVTPFASVPLCALLIIFLVKIVKILGDKEYEELR